MYYFSRGVLIRGSVAVLILALVAVACSTPQALTQEVTAPEATMEITKPSFVFILADDMTYTDLQGMENVGEGTHFDSAYVPTSSCCPSRSSILTGEYSHNTGVLSNTAPFGAWEAFKPHESDTIATRLDADYETALIGKYLNFYDPAKHEIPPGWDHFQATPPGDSAAITSGKMYQTLPLADDAVSFIEATSEPFFLYFSPPAPHNGSIPSEEHEDDWVGGVPRVASYNERDVSDKPLWVKARERLDVPQRQEMDVAYGTRQRTLEDLDDSVGRIVQALEDSGRLENTYVIFFSDNGFHMGEHRLTEGKTTAYEEDIHVPLIIRGPGVPTQTQSEIVANIDLAPTFAQIAGLQMEADGSSLVPLLDADETNDSGRKALLLEKWHGGTNDISFRGVRTRDYLFVRYLNQKAELYDMRDDPYQLRNLATKRPVIQKALGEKIKTLRDCSGNTCRSAEN